MTYFEEDDQCNFGIYQKKFLRPIQIVKKKKLPFLE